VTETVTGEMKLCGGSSPTSGDRARGKAVDARAPVFAKKKKAGLPGRQVTPTAEEVAADATS
jgi:hypothetical protein